jgi:hypothetical protein
MNEFGTSYANADGWPIDNYANAEGWRPKVHEDKEKEKEGK